MTDPITIIGLVALTTLAAVGLVVGVGLLRRGAEASAKGRQTVLLWLCMLGGIALLAYRMALVHRALLLRSHVDGVLVVATLCIAVVLYLRRPMHLPSLAPFAWPLLTLFYAWGICASIWTQYQFPLRHVSERLHVGTAYLGTLSFLVAAIAGAMYLHAQSRLRRHRQPLTVVPLGSLEAMELLIIRAAAIGFCLLSVVIVVGVLDAAAGRGSLGDQWWRSPKVILSGIAWLIYALVMNVRHATFFRGNRAAWLSILGAVFILAVLAFSLAQARHAAPQM